MKKVVFLSIGMLAFAWQSANAQILYSTYDDFSTGNGWGAGAITTFDYDGVTVNGLGNSSNPGGAGTAGSLQLGPVAAGWGAALWGPGITGGVYSALDGPGGIVYYSAASGYGPGSLVAASGVITMNYTMPDDTFGGSYFQPGIMYNYDGGYGLWGATSETDLGAVSTPTGTMEMYQATIPYTINATASVSYFQIGIGQNTDFSGANDWYVDEISVVPEPGVMALIGMGLTGLMLIRRRQQG